MDPDPAFFVNADLDTDPDPGFWWPKFFLKKFTAGKKLNFFIKNCHLLIPRPPKRTSKLQEKSSSLKREHPALQKLNFFHFCGSFWPSWIRIQLTKMNADLCGFGSGSGTLAKGISVHFIVIHQDFIMQVLCTVFCGSVLMIWKVGCGFSDDNCNPPICRLWYFWDLTSKQLI